MSGLWDWTIFFGLTQKNEKLTGQLVRQRDWPKPHGHPYSISLASLGQNSIASQLRHSILFFGMILYPSHLPKNQCEIAWNCVFNCDASMLAEQIQSQSDFWERQIITPQNKISLMSPILCSLLQLWGIGYWSFLRKISFRRRYPTLYLLVQLYTVRYM